MGVIRDIKIRNGAGLGDRLLSILMSDEIILLLLLLLLSRTLNIIDCFITERMVDWR